MEYAYRFRKCDFFNPDGSANKNSYLKSELENAEIYFSDFEHLNDPMEGYKDVYFQGDAVIWKNFFRNYILNLLLSFSHLLIGGSYKIIINKDVNVLETNRQLCEDFIRFPTISNLIAHLDGHKLTSEELSWLLFGCHPIAFELVANMLKAKGVLATDFASQPFPIKDEFYNSTWDDVFAENGLTAQAKFLMIIKEDLSVFRSGALDDLNASRLYIDFPDNYLEKLESIMYPPFYSASFSDNPNNSSMWGNYAQSHKGICLEFKVNDTSLSMYTCVGADSQGRKYDWVKHMFEPIVYDNAIVSMNFFENIGFISNHALHNLWCFDSETGMVTACRMVSDDNWQEYFMAGLANVNKKTKDWEYEKEYRLIMHSLHNDMSDVRDRTIKYDFNSLVGIIFGIKTSVADKRIIIETILNKCTKEGRDFDKFVFYQAYYNSDTGGIDKRRIFVPPVNPAAYES